MITSPDPFSEAQALMEIGELAVALTEARVAVRDETRRYQQHRLRMEKLRAAARLSRAIYKYRRAK